MTQIDHMITKQLIKQHLMTSGEFHALIPQKYSWKNRQLRTVIMANNYGFGRLSIKKKFVRDRDKKDGSINIIYLFIYLLLLQPRNCNAYD